MTDEQKTRVRALVAALLSGEYKQATHTLRNTETGGFCCLGVACDLFNKQADKDYWNGAAYSVDPDNLGEDGVLPVTVQKWYAFENVNPDLFISKTRYAASELNDEGHSFAEIAALFEKKYLTDSQNNITPAYATANDYRMRSSQSRLAQT